MADDMRTFMTGLFCLAGLLSLPLQAGELPDPTRPPNFSGTGKSEAEARKGLQSVIVSRERSAALIDGQTVELGGKYGDFKLIEVNETGVILEGAKGRLEMSLFPGVHKTVISSQGAP